MQLLSSGSRLFHRSVVDKKNDFLNDSVLGTGCLKFLFLNEYPISCVL